MLMVHLTNMGPAASGRMWGSRNRASLAPSPYAAITNSRPRSASTVPLATRTNGGSRSMPAAKITRVSPAPRVAGSHLKAGSQRMAFAWRKSCSHLDDPELGRCNGLTPRWPEVIVHPLGLSPRHPSGRRRAQDPPQATTASRLGNTSSRQLAQAGSSPCFVPFRGRIFA